MRRFYVGVFDDVHFARDNILCKVNEMATVVFNSGYGRFTFCGGYHKPSGRWRVACAITLNGKTQQEIESSGQFIQSLFDVPVNGEVCLTKKWFDIWSTLVYDLDQWEDITRCEAFDGWIYFMIVNGVVDRSACVGFIDAVSEGSLIKKRLEESVSPV
jgi:hypothetical protein